ncbi:MAG: hypothetical protein JNJ57_21640 [Saprospiraceae bacterium]|nr:hypothetical protein [Saprospiraceae bacterium]
MKRHILLLIITLYGLLVFSCRKPETPIDPLPPATQEGANTFGCYINGEPWVAEIAPYVLDPSVHKLEFIYDEPNTGLLDRYYFQMGASRVNDTTYDFIILSFMPINNIGEIDISNLSVFGSGLHLDYLTPKGYEVDVMLHHEFKLTRLDMVNNICSGLFSFTALSNSRQDTIHITDGRFDVKYSQE